jgi:hypothetical protein
MKSVRPRLAVHADARAVTAEVAECFIELRGIGLRIKVYAETGDALACTERTAFKRRPVSTVTSLEPRLGFANVGRPRSYPSQQPLPCEGSMRALRGHYPPRTLVRHASSACFLRQSDCLGPEQIDCWRCHHPSLAGCDLGSEGMSGHLQKRQDRTAARAIASLRCSSHSLPAVTPIHCPVPQAISFF